MKRCARSQLIEPGPSFCNIRPAVWPASGSTNTALLDLENFFLFGFDRLIQLLDVAVG